MSAIDNREERAKTYQAYLDRREVAYNTCVVHGKPVDEYGLCYLVTEDKPEKECVRGAEVSLTVSEQEYAAFIKDNPVGQAETLRKMAEDDPYMRLVLEIIETGGVEYLVTNGHVLRAMESWSAILRERVTIKEAE